MERQPARRVGAVHQGQFFHLSLFQLNVQLRRIKLALQVKPARAMTFPRLVLLSKHFQPRSFVVNIVSEDVCLPLMISPPKKYE